jgi:hypothetical protein
MASFGLDVDHAAALVIPRAFDSADACVKVEVVPAKFLELARGEGVLPPCARVFLSLARHRQFLH